MKTKSMTFSTWYGNQMRSDIIQWVDYHKNHHEARVKGSDCWTVIFAIDLIGRKLWWEFLSHRGSINF